MEIKMLYPKVIEIHEYMFHILLLKLDREMNCNRFVIKIIYYNNNKLRFFGYS